MHLPLKLYADAHDSLPPVEEEETDRQQRVYRGQPSTVSQVQRDRDGIIHQASINAIPNQGKIGSFAFGSQYRKQNIDFDYVNNRLDINENSIDEDFLNSNKTRRKRDLNEALTYLTQPNKTMPSNELNSTQSKNENQTDTDKNVTPQYVQVETSQEFIDDIDYDDYMDLNDTAIEESRRQPRQLRPSYAALRSKWPHPTAGSTKYRAVEPSKYQHPSQPSFTFGNFNPYLSPPAQNLNQLSPGYQVYQNIQQQSYTKKPKVVYTGYNLSLPPPPPPKMEDDFRPIVGYYNTGSTTTNYPAKQQPNLLPYILQSLKEITDQRNKVQAENFAYFHLDNDPVTQNPKPLGTNTQAPILQYSLAKHAQQSQKVTPNSHYSPISTVGGFYNNNNNNQQTFIDFRPTSKVTSRFNIGETQSPLTSTEPNYFQYNILANKKIQGFQNSENSPIREENPIWPNESFNNNATLPEFHASFTGGVVSTAQPAITTDKNVHKVEFNIPDFVSSLQPTDLENVNPQVMEMLQYFQQLNTKTKLSNGRRPILQKFNKFKTTELTTESSTEQYRFRSKTPLNKLSNSLNAGTTTTERPAKGYESFINSLPSQSTVYQTTTKEYSHDYYDETYPEEENLGNDSDDETQPPVKMPPYMPMSETMAPPRVQIMEPATTKLPIHTTGYFDTTTTRRPFISLKPLDFGHNQIPSFINFPSDFFQEIKNRPHLQQENKLESTTLATTTVRLTRPTSTPSSSTITTIKTKTRLVTTTPRSRQTLRPTRVRGQGKWQLNKVNTFKTRNNNNNKTDFSVNSFRKQRPSAAPSTAVLGTLNFNVNANSDPDAQKNR